jgi:uncharacterized protein with PIN domain/sulfur carrier protein ThiS
MMKKAYFRFHDEVGDLLPVQQRGRSFTYEFKGSQSVKHLIESQGIPHTEIGTILVNGKLVDNTYQVQQADRVEVYPPTDDLQKSKTNSEFEVEIRFILDNHLGKLAAYLRMLGFDACYRSDYQDDELAGIAEQDTHTLLTRDRRLLMRKQVHSGYCVRALDPKEQLKEVVKRFGLQRIAHPFLRCIRCNFILEDVDKEQIQDRLEPLTRQYYDKFRICPNCQQIYWQGSHFIRMERLIQEVLEA